jgi:hypothetical protein
MAATKFVILLATAIDKETKGSSGKKAPENGQNGLIGLLFVSFGAIGGVIAFIAFIAQQQDSSSETCPVQLSLGSTF